MAIETEGVKMTELLARGSRQALAAQESSTNFGSPLTLTFTIDQHSVKVIKPTAATLCIGY